MKNWKTETETLGERFEYYPVISNMKPALNMFVITNNSNIFSAGCNNELVDSTKGNTPTCNIHKVVQLLGAVMHSPPQSNTEQGCQKLLPIQSLPVSTLHSVYIHTM